MTQVSIQDVFLKKSGFFRSITILESPQLGIKKKEIKIIVCKIVLKRPKNKPFARDFFFIKNERARCWILYLAFTLVNYNNKLNFNVFTTNIWCWKSIQENRTDYSISEILFTYCLLLEEILNRSCLYFLLDSLFFWLDCFLFCGILTFSESLLLIWLCWSLVLTGVHWMCVGVHFSGPSVSSDTLTVPWWRLDDVA